MASQPRHPSHIAAHDHEEQPSATISHARLLDVTVAEWTVDLGAAMVGRRAPSTTSVVATGYVDFDAVESVHRARTAASSHR